MALNFEEIATTGEKEQLDLLSKLDKEIKQEFIKLMDDPHYMDLLEAANARYMISAILHMPDETKQRRDELVEKAAEIKKLKYYLYARSPYDSVKAATQDTVDNLISRAFPAETDDKYTGSSLDLHNQHNLLYLSTFGGKSLRKKRDQPYPLTYEFNAQTGPDKPVTAPREDMEYLFKCKMIKNDPKKTANITGNNLTYIGIAVLKRLNKKYGLPGIAGEISLPANEALA